MKIRLLVDGHTVQEYKLSYGKNLLKEYQSQGCLILDDETKQLTKVEFLNQDSKVTVIPAIRGG